MSIKASLSAALAFTVLGSSVVLAGGYCSRFADKMDAGSLYAASCARSSTCLAKVVTNVRGETGIIKRGKFQLLERKRRYTFLYKTDPMGPMGATNSLVIARIKLVAAAPLHNVKPPDVEIKRYGFHFACVADVYKGDESLAAWPSDPPHAKRQVFQRIPFDKFDHFHRYGFTTGDTDKELRQNTHFHVVYYNGKSCVSTLSRSRIRQFLLEDRDNVPWFIVSVANRLGGFFDVTRAEAQQAEKYEKLRVIVTNYQRKPNQSGCFEFTTRAGTAESKTLEISVGDVEKQVQSYPFDISKTWSFDLK